MVKPKKEFIVKRYRSIENPSEKVYIVFDGDEMLYDVKESNRLNMKELNYLKI